MVHEDQGVRSAAGHLHHPDRRPGIALQVAQHHLHHHATTSQPRQTRHAACPESPLRLRESARGGASTAGSHFLPDQNEAHNRQGRSSN